MMLFQAGRSIDPGKLRVRLNPGTGRDFAVIELVDGAALFIQSADEADALIRGAVEAKRLLAPPVLAPSGQGGVLFPAGDDEVTASEAEARGWCPATTFIEYDDVTLYCDRTAGHTGSHHAPGPDEGSEVAWGTLVPRLRRLAVAE